MNRIKGRSASILLALLVLPAFAHAALAADITLTCRVLSVHADGSQSSFLRKIEILRSSRVYTQSDDRGAGFELVGNGTIVKLGGDVIVLRDDQTIFWMIGGDGSYYLKNHVTEATQQGQCQRNKQP